MRATYKLTGTRDLIMHNGRLADPLDPHTKALAEVTAIRGKTEADHREVARRELIGGLYIDDDGPYIPGQNIETLIRDGAKFRKLGKAMTQGVMLEEFDVPLDYVGPRTAEEIAKDPDMTLRESVKVGTSRVMRTRPRFSRWSLTFNVEYDEDRVDVADIDRALIDAGKYIGLGDWRPRYGRFEMERIA